MGTYLAVMTIVAIVALCSMQLPRSYARVASIPAFTLIFLFMAFREKIGGDWEMYTNYFDHYANFSFITAYTFDPTEIGYAALNFVAGHLTGRFHVVLFICAVFFLFGLYRFARAYKLDPSLTLFLACGYFIFVAAMGYIRQGAAMGFAMAALAAMRQKRTAQFWMFTVCATLFHYSSAAFLLIMWAKTWKRLLIVACAALPVLVLGQSISTVSRLQSYGSGENATASGVYFRLLILGFGLLPVWFQRHKWKEHPEDFAVVKQFAIMYGIGMLIAAPQSTIVDRFALYMFPLYLLCLGKAIEFTPRPRQWMTTGLVFLHSYALTIFWFATSSFASIWTPYRIGFN